MYIKTLQLKSLGRVSVYFFNTLKLIVLFSMDAFNLSKNHQINNPFLKHTSKKNYFLH